MKSPSSLSDTYWQSLEIKPADSEYLLNYLFELEAPLSTPDMVRALVSERIRYEQEKALQKRKGSGKAYLPQETYQVGDELSFPALGWEKGKVTELHAGENPAEGAFEVMTVAMEDGEERFFAMSLEEHALNAADDSADGDGDIDLDALLAGHGNALEKKLATALKEGEDLVSIAGHWFPRALLVDVNIGHLNLAEAILDMAEGEPLETSTLMKDIDFPQGDNPRLTEFSLNYALQEDERFDEVGSTGKVLWCLERLEPEGVRNVPAMLQYEPIDLDRTTLTDEMLELESRLDDELSRIVFEAVVPHRATVSLLYPHWRLGTFPISERIRPFFPSAYESPRIRFTLIDGETGERMPAWVVRENSYVYGLKEWCEEKGLLPGSLIDIKPGDNLGEVVIQAQTHRSKRDWVRTVIAGTDGGLVFATLKQVINAKFDERMVMAIPDAEAIDNAWKITSNSKKRFETLVRDVMRELTKLNPQGNVHAQALYSAVNLLKRCPPAPLFSLLATSSWINHVGDLYFRLEEESTEEA